MTPSRWLPGDVVVIREVAGERIFSARPAIVVEDRPDQRMFFTPAGITMWVATDGAGDEVRLPVGPWTLRPSRWGDSNVLSFAWPDERHAILAMWDRAWRFRRWYVNVEDPLRPTRLGFDTTELLLDLVIQPDLGSWAWKDEDEVDRAVALGLLDAADVGALRAAAQRGRRRVTDREQPFDRDWTSWRPDPGWPVPELPDGWDVLER